MSQENVELVRRILERFGKTGKPDLSDLDPGIEIHDHELPDSQIHHGHDGFMRSIEDWESAWDDYSFDLEEVIDAGDRVVVILHTTATGRISGLKLDRRDAQIYELRDAKVVRLDYYSTKAEALDAAGLRE
jgi:ketosteroid isomerase-like protein